MSAGDADEFRMISLEDAAALLDCSPVTLRREADAGKITLVRIRGRLKVPLTALRAYIADAEYKPGLAVPA